METNMVIVRDSRHNGYKGWNLYSLVDSKFKASSSYLSDGPVPPIPVREVGIEGAEEDRETDHAEEEQPVPLVVQLLIIVVIAVFIMSVLKLGLVQHAHPLLRHPASSSFFTQLEISSWEAWPVPLKFQENYLRK